MCTDLKVKYRDFLFKVLLFPHLSPGASSLAEADTEQTENNRSGGEGGKSTATEDIQIPCWDIQRMLRGIREQPKETPQPAPRQIFQERQRITGLPLYLQGYLSVRHSRCKVRHAVPGNWRVEVFLQKFIARSYRSVGGNFFSTGWQKCLYWNNDI